MIYLDNAATSFPKPPKMAKDMYNYILKCGASYGRGGYKSAVESMDILWQTRENISTFINSKYPEQLIFTKNATEALNITISGMLKPGTSVIVTPLEHNSVMRPLINLKCNIDYLPLKDDGSCDITPLQNIPKNTKMVIINHASNVSGVLNDVAAASMLCNRQNIPCLIDASQSAGSINLYADDWNAMIAFPGHKGLLGPQGTGILYIPRNMDIAPLITGGTGSNSEDMRQPEIMPDKFESGTLNMPAICGLYASVAYIQKEGIDKIYEHEHTLTKKIIEELCNIKDVHVLCAGNLNRTSTVSFYIDGKDSNEIGSILDEKYNIATRCGLHCAPMAHKTYGTLETGTIRVSPGAFNTNHDINKFLKAINRICP